MGILFGRPGTRTQGWTHLALDAYCPERGLHQSQSDCVIINPLLFLKNVADCVELGSDECKFEDGQDETHLAAGHIEPARMLRMSPLLSIESWWRDNRFSNCLACLSCVNA